MKLKSTTLVLLAGAAGLSTSARAIEARIEEKPEPEVEVCPAEELAGQLFKIADADGDGKLTPAEFAKAFAEMQRRILAENAGPQPLPVNPGGAAGAGCPACGLG